jgi:hypothetical protein
VRIAILGWGSLLWDGGADFDQWHGPWEYDGPTLKLEFSRVSQSRLGSLTLVIDEDNGTPITVAWCLSMRKNVDDAACDLRLRERTTFENIGRVVVPHRTAESMSAAKADAPIPCWARHKNLDAVVWTALRSNFSDEVRQPFTVQAAVSHLKTLKPAGKAKAAEYVWRAPSFVKTPLRSTLETEPWFPKVDS